MKLESLALGDSAKIALVDWDQLAPEEGQRLRALGLDVGAEVTIAHRGVFGGGDDDATDPRPRQLMQPWHQVR